MASDLGLQCLPMTLYGISGKNGLRQVILLLADQRRYICLASPWLFNVLFVVLNVIDIVFMMLRLR